MNQESGAPRDQRVEIPRAEWFAAAVGVLLLLGSIGIITRQAVMSGGSPPRVELQVTGISQEGRYWLVRVEATNGGDRTAANLAISGELRGGTPAPELSHATIDYLPPRSRRGAGLYFSSDPRAGALRLRPMGYEEP